MIKYDLLNKRFGKLVVIENLPSKNQCRMWLCRCDCGGTKITSTKMLVSKQCMTCGCSKYTRARKHGLSHTKVYKVWATMVKRVTNTNCKDWNLYGGRGISIDKNWLSFQGFWNDMGTAYKHGLYLDRIDNNGNKYKKNCRWVDAYTQANNTRRNRFLTFNGTTLTESQWNRKLGLGKGVISRRLKRGWSYERSFA